MADAVAPTEKMYSLAEVKQHTTEKSCWLIIHGNVYDVTNFLEEHPGGYDIILTVTGRDATQDFEEIGHSPQANGYLKKYLIGKFEGGDSAPAVTKVASAPSTSAATTQVSPLSRAFSVLLPVILILVAVFLNMNFGKK